MLFRSTYVQYVTITDLVIHYSIHFLMTSVRIILQTKPADFTGETAVSIIELLMNTLAAADGITSRISPTDLTSGVTMLKKLKKFVNRQGSEVDEMRARIRRLESSIPSKKFC